MQITPLLVLCPRSFGFFLLFFVLFFYFFSIGFIVVVQSPVIHPLAYLHMQIPRENPAVQISSKHTVKNSVISRASARKIAHKNIGYIGEGWLLKSYHTASTKQRSVCFRRGNTRNSSRKRMSRDSERGNGSQLAYRPAQCN